MISRLDIRLADFGSQRSQVLIVSATSADAIEEFCASEQLSISILSDPDGQIATPLALPADIAIVVADKDGRIRETFPISADIDAVLDVVRVLRNGHDAA